MAVRNASAAWEGNLRGGKGQMQFGTFNGPFSYASRFEEGQGTNPEELIGAALAGCYSMALSNELDKAGFTPARVGTQAQVTLGKVNDRSRITGIHLNTEARVPGISQQQFQEIATATKSGCPVGAALTGVEITLDAQLVQ